MEVSLMLFLRFVILALLIFAFYKLLQYIFDPKRKLDEAYEKGNYYVYDDVKNVRKNFFITYKGALFEGEKYLGTTDNSFDVISIFVSVHNLAELHGLTKEDFEFLQNEILMSYPSAKISWIEPIEKLIRS